MNGKLHAGIVLKQHHEELEKVARQVEQLVVGQESLQDDMDYLLRRSLRKKG